MSDLCRRTEELLSDRSGASPDEPDGHVSGCPTCRQQIAADQALREHFAELASPSLSPRFSSELRSRLAVERKRLGARRLWGRMLQVYWLAATVASAAIVWRLPDVSTALSGSWPALPGLLLLSGLLPLALMLRVLRKDPIELMFSTVEWLLGSG